MAGTKEFNRKIKSLKNTEKITRTMKMVAASKLRRAQEAQAYAKFFPRRLTELTSRLSASLDVATHPLLHSREKVKNVIVLVITSDRGLCGGFNHNIHKEVITWLEEHKSRRAKIDLYFCGKRGFQFFRKSPYAKKFYDCITDKPDYRQATMISKDLITQFLSGNYDEVYLTYNTFINPISQKTTFLKILPVESAKLLT